MQIKMKKKKENTLQNILYKTWQLDEKTENNKEM